jgi:hypothetical protein
VRRAVSFLPAIGVGWAMMLSPAQADIGSLPSEIIAESDSLRVILDAFLSIPALMPGVRTHVGAQVQDLMNRDPKVDRLLKASPALRGVLIERAATQYDLMLQAKLPAARAFLGRGLRADMTAPQLTATAKLFSSETGKRLIASVLTKMLSETDEQAEAVDLSDAEAVAMINKKDTAVILAFSQTGAAAKLEKIFLRLEEAKTEYFEPMVDEDDLLLGILEQLQSDTNYPT